MRKTERSAVAVISNWVREVIDTKRMPLGGADVDTIGSDAKSPDLIIRMGPNDDRIVLLAEFKQPYFDAFDEKELKEPAHRKAVRRQAPYFATSNF
ncbi:MAG TPA: hypothetical protein VGK61_09905, partial [Planctomycetota bacterium]